MHKHIAAAVGIFTFASGAFSPATAHPPTVRTNRGVIVTKTSAAPFSIVLTAKQRLEIYSAAPQYSGPLVGVGVENLLGWSLAHNGVTVSSPMPTNYGASFYVPVPDVIVGPATLSITPGAVPAILTYSIMAN